VLGKHFPGLEFLSTLMADSPALSPDVSYYQRLLARDQGEAADIIQRHVASQPPDTVYDAVMLPALTYAERDRFEGRLTGDDEQAVADQTRELLADVETLLRSLPAPERSETEPDEQPSTAAASSDERPHAAPVEVLAYPANGPSDAIALQMLAQLVDSDSIRLNPTSIRPLSSEVIDLVRTRGVRLVCIADLPPSPPSKTRYLVRKLRAALPEVRILIGRWGPESLSDEERASLMDAGANHVATTLIETRNELRTLAVYAG
jgi:hypothetical protein